MNGTQKGVCLNRAIGRGRAVGSDAQGVEHELDAKEMKPVAHRDAGLFIPLPEYRRHCLYALVGGVARGFREDLVLRHALLDQVVPADVGFRKVWIPSASAGGDDQWGETKVLEFQDMIETCFQDRGRSPVVLRGSKNDNRIGGACFVVRGLPANTFVEGSFGECQRKQSGDESQKKRIPQN